MCIHKRQPPTPSIRTHTRTHTCTRTRTRTHTHLPAPPQLTAAAAAQVLQHVPSRKWNPPRKSQPQSRIDLQTPKIAAATNCAF